MRVAKLLVLICMVGLVLSLISCTDPGLIDTQSYQLVIMQGGESCDYQKMVLDSDSYWPALIASYPAHVVHTITQEGIKSYDWNAQTITLTDEESEVFSEVTKGWELKMFPPEGGSIESCNFTFLVLINDEPIYGGVFINPHTQIPINYPVIYPNTIMGVTSLSVNPSNIPMDSKASQWKIIKDKRIHNVFESVGKLVD